MKTGLLPLASFCLSASVLIGCSSSPTNSTPSPTPTPTPVAPAVSAVAPATLTAGAGATTLTVTGTGFTSATSIQVGGSVEPTTFVSSTQVTAAVPATQLASGASLPIIALNGSSTSAGSVVNLVISNLAPAISGIVPATLTTGSPSTTVSVTGTGFTPTTALQVAGSSRSTTFVSTTQVNVILTTADLAASGGLSVAAVNPAPGGGTSAAASVAINNPAPGAITVAPATLVTGAATPTTVTVTGSNFLPSSTVQIGSSSRPATFVSASQLTFQLTVADQAAAAHLAISVVTPAPGGGTSPVAYLTLNAPTPTPVIATLSPSQFIVGSPATYITVSGTNLTSTSVVEWNGTPLMTSYFLSGYTGATLNAAVPAGLLTTAGTASVTVSSPSATPMLSNALTVTISNPPAPTLTSISPTYGPINTATPITVTGTGFTSSSTVAFNGTALATTFVNSGQLTVTLAAASIALPGNGNLTVTTPAPGGGTTAPLVFTSYVPLVNNSMIYNPVNGLFYLSVPSSVAAPFGNSVVSVDPATGAFGTPIFVGSEPNKMALTSDGKYLWVGLDGASAVRKVDLTAGTAGLQFSFGHNAGIYNTPPVALALAALPGATDSVVVSSTLGLGSNALTIYDSGVPRASAAGSYNFAPYALLVDGTRGEIYAAAQSYYSTYTYNASGVALKANTTTSATYATSYSDEIEIAGGILYTDFGQAFDPESGSLLGTFYSSGTTVASGPAVADVALGKVFILDNSAPYSYGSYNQIQVFNTSDYNPASSSVIPLSVNVGSTGVNPYPSRLTRWGANGLAFRTPVGFFSLRSNVVKDLSSTSADVGVSLGASGANAAGSNTTYTATVSNAGPSAATEVTLTANLPSSAVLVSATPSVGACSTGTSVSCDLGGLAVGANATVTFVVEQITTGSATMTVAVSSSDADPVSANNQATSTQTITGSSSYNLVPTLSSLSPGSIVTGSSDTVLTVTGTGFASGAAIQLDGAALPTTFTSSTQLTATVPAAKAAALGWSTVSVTNPAPGGGTSAALPLSYYSVITLGVNHILYDPYSRKIMASVGSGSSSITGNSLVAITPETATVGSPVPIGSQPESLALSSDGQVLYTVLSGSGSVARFNMLTQTADFTFSLPTTSGFETTNPAALAVQPGNSNTLAIDLGAYAGTALFDVNPAAQTGTERGSATGIYTASCPQFLDASDVLAFEISGWGTLDDDVVTSSGFAPFITNGNDMSTLNHFGCFKLSGGLAFGNQGGVANPSTHPATQLGVFPISSVASSGNLNVAPDASLGRTFFAVSSASGTYYFNGLDSIASYNNNTYLPSVITPLGFAAVEGSNNTSFTVTDLVRWGQDGIAVLTSTGHIYLLRGPGVAEQLLKTNSAATLTASSVSTLTHGAGNSLLTLTGSNFIPGVAVLWNGSYRTTTIVDPTHVTVAIPASDLVATGTASLTAVNPGASASGTLIVTIN